MRSETDFALEIRTTDVKKEPLTGLELYAMFRRKSLEETLESRRRDFAKASDEERSAMIVEVENEIEAFCSWLMETKEFDAHAAHYCSMSVKSVLLGLPAGESFAEMFSLITRALRRV
jgi:hypothetical protein